MKKRCAYLLIVILHMQLIQDLTQPVCKEPWLKFSPLNGQFLSPFYQPHFINWNHMNKLKFKCRQSSPWVTLLQQNTHSAALPSSQSITEIFIFWLHCSLNSTTKIRNDRYSSLLKPPFFYLLDLFSLPQRHRVCMKIPACCSKAKEGGSLSPKCHWEWHWQHILKRRVTWRRS